MRQVLIFGGTSEGRMLSEYLDGLRASGDLSQEIYEKVCWKNAVKLLKLPLAEKDFA